MFNEENLHPIQQLDFMAHKHAQAFWGYLIVAGIVAWLTSGYWFVIPLVFSLLCGWQGIRCGLIKQKALEKAREAMKNFPEMD